MSGGAGSYLATMRREREAERPAGKSMVAPSLSCMWHVDLSVAAHRLSVAARGLSVAACGI